jgi:hypothetical protein
MRKDITLIILGALISMVTSIITTSLNEKREERKANIQKRLELNDQLSKDLGKRLYLTLELFKGYRDNDTVTIALKLQNYRLSKEDWNIKIYSYQSLLKHYYSETTESEFLDSVYNPLVTLGQEAEYKKYDKSFTVKWDNNRKKITDFVSQIYNKAN